MASAAGSLFARTYAGHTGVDPYTTAVSDVYQDLFNEGIFTGQGPLRRRRVRRIARGPRAGERAAVARSLRGPLCAHGPRHGRRGRRRLPVERPRARETPAPLGARRLADPAGGSFRSCRRRRVCSAIACRSSSRWKILDNLRRSLMAPATVAAAPPRLDRAAGLARRLDGDRASPPVALPVGPAAAPTARRADAVGIGIGVPANHHRRSATRTPSASPCSWRSSRIRPTRCCTRSP